jgi:hypothetical protein
MDANELEELKAEIAVEIAAHRDRYKDAGKWLDEFCSEKECRKRQKAALKKAEVEYAEEATEGRANCISDLKRRIKRRRKISGQMCLSDAVHYWLERYKGYQLVTVEDGRRILLIALLLLEPDSETVADILTPFAQWTWMTDEEIDGRAWAGIPLCSGEYWDNWRTLIRAALKQVRLQEQLAPAKEPAETEQEIAPGIFGWMKGWLWKLYEKTLKVVVEAILERLWPKSS